MYLIDSSAVWRIQRDPAVRDRWRHAIEAGEVRSCAPQRIELCRSARNVFELDEMSNDLERFYPEVGVPKGTWRWIDAAQQALVRAGALRAFSLVDLMVCATSAAHGLVILHDDGDFETAARYLVDVRVQRV